MALNTDMHVSPNSQKAPEGLHGRLLAAFMAILMTLMLFLHSIFQSVTAKLLGSSSKHNQTTKELGFPKGSAPPSPLPSLTDKEILATVLKRLSELEERVYTLQEKPLQMPYEKEELLNAAVYRVDALEAELITTKKALHEALMRQEELLAYIDSQESSSCRKKKFSCW